MVWGVSMDHTTAMLTDQIRKTSLPRVNRGMTNRSNQVDFAKSTFDFEISLYNRFLGANALFLSII